MSGRWSSRSNKDDLPDFQKLFNSPDFSVLDLLDIDSIVEKVKRANNKFTEKLINHRNIVYGLIDIALQPIQYAKIHQVQVSVDMVHKSIEILTNQSDEFTDFLVGIKVRSQQIEDEVLSDVVQEQRDWTVFQYLLKLFEAERINETAASYFSKILTSVVYQKSSQMMEMLRTRPSIQQLFVNNFYSKSVSELFWKILQMEDSSSFFEKDKILLLNQMPYLLQKQNDLELVILSMENVVTTYEELLLKNDDKFDKAKYITISRQITNEPYLYKFIIDRVNQYPDSQQIQMLCLQLLEILLRFTSTLRQSPISKSSQSNLDSSFNQIKINSEIIQFVQTYILKISNRILDSPKNNLTKINYFRVIHCLIIIDQNFIDLILTEQFVKRTLLIMINNPNNNILHNLLKDIYIESIKRMDGGYKRIISQTTNFITTCKAVLTEKNSLCCYQNQLYHILTAIFNKIIAKFGDLEKCQMELQTNLGLKELLFITQKKLSFYNTEIGGNPRKQTQSWDCSSNQIVINVIQKLSLNGQLENKTNQHWLDSQLPLDSDDSQQQNTPQPETNNAVNQSEKQEKNKQQAQTDKQYEDQQYDEFTHKPYNTYIRYDVEELIDELL